MDKLDTGDVIFSKFNCDHSISNSSYVECLKKELSLSSNFSYDAVGVIIRHKGSVSIITNINKKIENLSYPQFLSLPIFDEVNVRKLKINVADPEFQKLFAKRALLLYYQLEAYQDLKSKKNEEKEEFWEPGDEVIKGEIEEGRIKNFLKNSGFEGNFEKEIEFLKKNKVVKDIYKFEGLEKFDKYQTGYEMFFDQMNMLRDGVEEIDIEDLACEYPAVWRDVYSLDKRIIIRAKNNMDLLRDEAFGR